LLTNGYMLSKGMIDAIEKTQIDVSISLDGIGDVHDTQRPTVGGKGSFSDIHSNITKLSEVGVKPFIMTTVTRHNQGHLQELAEYCTERGMGFRLSLYRGKATEENDFVGDHKELADDLVRFYEWFGDHLPEESLYRTHRFCDINLLRPKIANCGVGKSSIVIDANGDLAICQYQIEQVIGSLAKGDSVLASLENQEFYQPDHDSGRFVNKCSSCQWLYTCANGCPLHVKAVYDTFMRESPYCSVYKAVLPVLICTHAKQIIRKGGDFDE